MRKTIAEFSVEYLQILDENGKCDEKLRPKISNSELKKMYEIMVLTRIFDEKAVRLQRQGRLGTYAAVKGQEACQIGPALLMKRGDFAFPAFREHCLFIARGVSLTKLYQYWGGDERGMFLPKGTNILPVSIPVGSHPLHAVGTAMAFQYQKKKNVSIAFFGDGATSEGDTLEAMNFAGAFKAPCVFVCQNNQWAISVPRREQTAAQTLAQKAIAFGFLGIQVDGNDVFAVYKAFDEAQKKARSGKGPTLIECYTYRLGDHTTSDDASKYRTKKELAQWEKKDPILRFEKYLVKENIVTGKFVRNAKANAQKNVDKAVKEYEVIKPYPPEDIFNYIFEKPTPELEEQKKKFLGGLKNGKDKYD